MDTTVILAVVTAVPAAAGLAWWRRARRARVSRTVVTADEDRSYTGSSGPVSDQLGAAPRPRRRRRDTDGFDPDGLPLSRDFLPEEGDPPPVERDLFAELARRRMRDTDT